MKERYPDWPVRMNEYIAAVRDNSYEWGTHDCCTFSGGCIEAMTGEDPMEEFRGKYNSEESAIEVLKEIGNVSLYRTLYRKFGKPLRGCYGQIGDLGFYNGNCGIIIGRFGLFLIDEGLAHIRLSQIQRVFRIGANTNG